jgi:hypothetical protein
MDRLVRGRVNIAQVVKLQRAGGPLPYPTGRPGQAERETIRRLEQQGVIQRNHDERTYELVPGIKVRFQQPLLDRLHDGPLRSKDWREVAVSRESLRVQIVQLKRSGWDIIAEPDEFAEGPRHGGYSPVRYVLRGRARAAA